MLGAPTKVVSILPAKEESSRTELKVLDGYVEQIRLWSSQSMQTDAIPFGDVLVAVTPWTARALQRFCNTPAPPQGKIDDLATEAVALIAKCRTDLGSGENDDEQDLNVVYARQAETMLNVAVGGVVLKQIQKKCSELIAEGRNEDMRELNALQHQVRKAVQDARGSLGESEQRRASEFATAFGDGEPLEDVAAEPETLPLAESPAPALAGRKPAAAPASHRTPRPAARPSTFILPSEEPAPRKSKFQTYVFWLVLLAMAGGLAAVGVERLRSAPPIQGDASSSLTTAMADFPGITAVQDRNPYVLLTVHTNFWDTTNNSRRQEWINDLRRLAERHGYSGLMLRSTGGVPLAEWVQDRGIKYAAEE